MADRQLDLRGMECPLPALKTRKALRGMGIGERLEIRCTDPLTVVDIPHLVHQTGDALERAEKCETEFIFVILKTGK
jgi:tRNA 2-thiouridine synthesizing protein A